MGEKLSDLSVEEHAQNIIARLRQDEAVLATHREDLHPIIESAISAVEGRDFERVLQSAEQLREWLRHDYINRARMVDTVQLLYLFHAAFSKANDVK